MRPRLSSSASASEISLMFGVAVGEARRSVGQARAHRARLERGGDDVGQAVERLMPA